MLGAVSDKSGLLKWRKRVGEEQANKVSAMATRRGTSMHKLCEQYLLNKEVEDDNYDGLLLFRSISPFLNRMDNIRALETPLYSHTFKIAGTVDCIAEYDNKLSIIDFKTASRPKKPEYIEGYFKQGAFYFWSYYEITGELPEQILILISVADGTVQEFFISKKEIIKYTELLKKDAQRYYNEYINNTAAN